MIKVVAPMAGITNADFLKKVILIWTILKSFKISYNIVSVTYGFFVCCFGCETSQPGI